MTGICNVCSCAILGKVIIVIDEVHAIQHYHFDCFDKLQKEGKKWDETIEDNKR